MDLATLNYTNVNWTSLNLPGPILNGSLALENVPQVLGNSTGDEGNSTYNSTTPENWSKGVRSISWISVPGYKVQFYVTGDTAVFTGSNKWQSQQLEVESSRQPGYIGKYGFSVLNDRGSTIWGKEDKINSYTEIIEGGDITGLVSLLSLITPEVALSFGFSDTVRAAYRQGILPNTDACWVTVTPNQSKWLGRLAPPKSPQAAKSFNTLVLPAPHDAGMNAMDYANALLSRYAPQILSFALTEALGRDIAAKIVQSVDQSSYNKVSEIIAGLSITQKDSTQSMLAIGARYFEYRPAYISTLIQTLGQLPIPNKLYFHHGIVPGQAFDDFLTIIVKFLAENPTEIVVVHVRGDGIPNTCRKPSSDEVNQMVDQTIKQFGGSSVLRGDSSDMSRSIDELRQQNKRLILLQVANQYSNWDEPKWATLDGKSILDTFPGLIQKAPEKLKDATLAVWQIQATGTSVNRAVIPISIFASGLTSVLLATKPIVDAITLPWLQSNVFPSMPSTKLQVIMNDWFDGATADVAIKLSEQYLNQGSELNATGNIEPVAAS